MSFGRGLALALALVCAACSDQAVPNPAASSAGSSALPAAGAAGEAAVAGAAGVGPGAAGGSAGAAPSNAAGSTGLGGSAGAAGGTAGGGSGPIVPADGPASSRQTERPLGTTPSTQGFYEYLPPGYGDGMLRPLLVFFHGGGERGNGTTELSKLLVHGPPWLIVFVVFELQGELCRPLSACDDGD